MIAAGDGNDDASAGKGRDLMIGGSGADDFKAGDDEDVLITGYTSFDSNLAALSLLQAEWTSSGSYAARVNNLLNGTGAILTGTGVKLSNSGPGRTVFDDYEKDTLMGEKGIDLIFSGVNDTIKNAAPGELIIWL